MKRTMFKVFALIATLIYFSTHTFDGLSIRSALWVFVTGARETIMPVVHDICVTVKPGDILNLVGFFYLGIIVLYLSKRIRHTR